MHRMEAQNIDSKFRLVLLAAERAEQLLGGSRPKLPHTSIKLARGAMEEVLEGFIEWEYGPAPVPETEESEEAPEEGKVADSA